MRFDREFLDGGPGVGRLLDGPTPRYVYSLPMVRAAAQRLIAAFPGHDICYSLKANPHRDIVGALARAGCRAEVSSRAELAVALGAGIAADDIIFVGPAKGRADIEECVGRGVHAIVADSADELADIESAAAAAGRDSRVLLRINTREPSPEAKEVMVGGPSKFGFDEEQVIEQARAVRLGRARIGGIQVYSASSVLDPEWLGRHIDYVAALARRLEREIGFGLETVDFGGGFGVPYAESQPELDLGPVARAAARARESLAGCRLLFESGRYLIAEAGVFCTRVVRVKESRGRLFAICDGGMNAFARPVFMRLTHPVRLLNRRSEPADTAVDICGPICTPLDCSARGAMLPRPRPGDIVGFLNAGAYGRTMSLVDFMSLGHPAEELLDSPTG
jgi:diaminopimelate decarboxylase